MNQAERLCQICARLATFSGEDQNITGPIGYLLGAAYSLIEAQRLCYLYGDIVDADYSKELRAVAVALADGKASALVIGRRKFAEGSDMSLPGIWLAGFYFNSALHRLAAAAERLGMHPTKGDVAESPLIAKVRDDVNRLKHRMLDQPDQESKGLLPGRSVTSIPMAIDALSHLVDLCASKGILDVPGPYHGPS